MPFNVFVHHTSAQLYRFCVIGRVLALKERRRGWLVFQRQMVGSSAANRTHVLKKCIPPEQMPAATAGQSPSSSPMECGKHIGNPQHMRLDSCDTVVEVRSLSLRMLRRCHAKTLGIL